MIRRQQHGEVLELQLDRPPANALNGALVDALDAALRRAAADDCGGIVLSGRPGMFCAGLDVVELIELDARAMRGFARRFFGLFRTLAESPVPVVAAITGHAPAGGTVIAAFCDRRVMTRGRYKLGFTELAVGVPVPRAALRALERLLGARMARECALQAQVMDADAAHAVGLVDELADEGEAVNRALDWLHALLQRPSAAALAQTREYLCEPMRAAFEQLDDDADRFARIWHSAPTQASLRAIVDGLKSRG